MLHMKEIQAIAALPAPILTVYVNTQNRNASRHPRMPEHLAWLADEARSLPPTLLAADAKRFDRNSTACGSFSKDGIQRDCAGHFRWPPDVGRDSPPDHHPP